MTSVCSGTNWSKKKGTKGIAPFLSRFSVRSAFSTFLYIKAPMLPRLRSPLQPPITTSFGYSCHRHIHCATSPAIAQTSSFIELHPSPSGSGTALRQIEQPSTAGPSSPSNPTTPSKIGDSSRAPATTEPACQFTLVHIPQIRRHQVLRYRTFP